MRRASTCVTTGWRCAAVRTRGWAPLAFHARERRGYSGGGGLQGGKQARRLLERAEELREVAAGAERRLETAGEECAAERDALLADGARAVADCNTLAEMIEEAGPEELPLLAQELQATEEATRALHVASLMCRPNADADAFLSLNAGAGGDDSTDWCQMLLRMYTLWAGKAAMEVEEVDLSEGEHGIKSATVKISGESAFGWLELETGVHRLVRISPFDSKARRHTSFAVVQVLPCLADEGHEALAPGDLKIETKRASGAGGQHVNTTDSAVRITHIPTGLSAQANSRSQHRNRALAMSMITARVLQQKTAAVEKERSEARQSLAGKSWGEQIRNYILHPSQTVVDLRSRHSMNPITLLDGGLEPMLLANLEHHLAVADDHTE